MIKNNVSSSPIRQMHRDKGEVMECVGMEGDEVDCVQRHDPPHAGQKGRVGGAGGAGGSTGKRDGDVLMCEVGEMVSQASEKSCRLISLIFRYNQLRMADPTWPELRISRRALSDVSSYPPD